MIHEYTAIREVANAIADEADDVMIAYKMSRVTDEPHITDRFMGAIESRIRQINRTPLDDAATRGGIGKHIIWEAHTLRSGSRSAAHEKQFGADILGVFTANTAKYKLSKGFLAQAKRAEPGVDFTQTEWNRMVAQCDKMLEITPDAFVMAYSKRRGLRFFSALAVTALKGRNLFELYSMPPRAFFERHFESFIGDKRLNQPDISVLKRLQAKQPEDERPSAHVLELKAMNG